MPAISTISDVRYQPLWPYHHSFDNLPLDNINKKIGMVNAATDANTVILQNARGTVGSVDTRLSQSLEQNGDLKLGAVDDLMHGIGHHSDEAISISGPEISDLLSVYAISVSNPVSMVRMLEVERAKLALIADEATSLVIQIDDSPSTTQTFSNATAEFAESDTISWSVDGGLIKANYIGSPSSPTHYYAVSPIDDGGGDYHVAYTFDVNTLRVYVNGVRLKSGINTMVPKVDSPTVVTWKARTFTASSPNFTITPAVTAYDVVTVDFDVA